MGLTQHWRLQYCSQESVFKSSIKTRCNGKNTRLNPLVERIFWWRASLHECDRKDEAYGHQQTQCWQWCGPQDHVPNTQHNAWQSSHRGSIQWNNPHVSKRVSSSGGNITTDNYFTSSALIRDLLKQKLTLVGTLKGNKRSTARGSPKKCEKRE